MIQPPFAHQITFLYTEDLKETVRFYEETLELPLALDQGTCRIYQVSPGGYLGFCQGAQAADSASGVIVTLVTQEVDVWYRRLSERGVLFEKPPSLNQEYSIYHCFLRDPNGYLIEIQRFEDPRWQSGRGLSPRPGKAGTRIRDKT